MGIRYLIQIFVMVFEVVLPCAGALLLYDEPRKLINWLLVAIGFMVWHNNGGFCAWRPKTIKQFLANAKKLGL